MPGLMCRIRQLLDNFRNMKLEFLAVFSGFNALEGFESPEGRNGDWDPHNSGQGSRKLLTALLPSAVPRQGRRNSFDKAKYGEPPEARWPGASKDCTFPLVQFLTSALLTF